MVIHNLLALLLSRTYFQEEITPAMPPLYWPLKEDSSSVTLGILSLQDWGDQFHCTKAWSVDVKRSPNNINYSLGH